MAEISSEWRIPLIINGEEKTLNEREFPVRNASKGTIICNVQGASVEAATSAVDSAHNAFPAWARTTPQERRRLLQNFAKVCLRNGKIL
jgi:acyl-CoA reductase-like NAD-dependent aldehyde dehydrogenase